MNSIRQIKLLIVNLFQSSTGNVGSERQRQYFKLVLASFYLVQLMPQWAHFSHPAIICCTLWEIFGNVTTLSLFRVYIWDYVLIYAPVLNYVHTTHFHWHLKIYEIFKLKYKLGLSLYSTGHLCKAKTYWENCYQSWNLQQGIFLCVIL